MKKNLMLKKWYNYKFKNQKNFLFYLYCFGGFKYFWRFKNIKKNFNFLFNKLCLFYKYFIIFLKKKLNFFFISVKKKLQPTREVFIPNFKLKKTKFNLLTSYYNSDLNYKDYYYNPSYVEFFFYKQKQKNINYIANNNNDDFFFNDLKINFLTKKNLFQKNIYFFKNNFLFFEFLNFIEINYIKELKILLLLLILNNKFF